MAPRKKQVYLASILFGGVALVADKCVLTESVTNPEPAAALLPDRHAVAKKPAQGSQLAAVVEMEMPELPFPRPLPPFGGQSPVRDLFRPPFVLESDDLPESLADNEGAGGKQNMRLGRAAFLQRYRLHGVLLQQRLRIAIIDGHWFQIGDSLGGCKLTAITEDTAHFLCVDGEAILNVLGRDDLERH